MARTHTAIIFDFDGVLADTQMLAYRIVCKVADRKKVPQPTMEFLKKHRTQEILSSLHVRWWELPYYVYLARKWTADENEDIQLFPWAAKLFQKSQQLSENVWVVSSNTHDTIKATLEKYQIKLNHEQIHGGIGVFQKKKTLRRLIQKHSLEPKRVVYVGDESRDVEAARSAGIKSACVSWGYQSEELLSSLSPDFLIRAPEDFEFVLSRIFE